MTKKRIFFDKIPVCISSVGCVWFVEDNKNLWYKLLHFISVTTSTHLIHLLLSNLNDQDKPH